MATRLRSTVTLVLIGTVSWVIAGVIAIAINAEAKIIWTCIVGVLLGINGIRYTIKRNRRSGI